jgi:hypothetical protein
MSLKRGIINPLNALNLRKLNWMPKHFSKAYIDQFIDIKELENWIEFNLESRYFLKNSIFITDKNRISEHLIIGVEDPKELTFLMIGCSFLHNRS